MRIVITAILLLSSLAAVGQEKKLTTPEEDKHLKNVKQLTFGGENAEAYFSADNQWLIFQHAGEGVPCDRIYMMRVAGGEPKMQLVFWPVSDGKGKTTCSYFFPDGDRVLFSSTEGAGAGCPPRPDYSHGYVWPIYSSYDLYTAKRDGSGLKKLTDSPGYDAEATITRDGKHIVFTSTRDGDLEIYTMDADGKNVKRLTHELGYDGGPFWSADGNKIVYRAQRAKTKEEAEEYKTLLKQGLIKPGNLEIWVMNADGSGKHQVTHNGASNFGPFWHPDGKRIIFSSNLAQPDSMEFDLYLINEDGSGLERVTSHPGFDGFPMFSSDGKRLVWASNRNQSRPHETNIFIADWVE
ncbi:MAG TPA: hypothetical protein VMS96_04135 [Terriglobales bacterium]|nr:hypothetical protein [Terriglobales bacterium]